MSSARCLAPCISKDALPLNPRGGVRFGLELISVEKCHSREVLGLSEASISRQPDVLYWPARKILRPCVPIESPRAER